MNKEQEEAIEDLKKEYIKAVEPIAEWILKRPYIIYLSGAFVISLLTYQIIIELIELFK